MSQISFKQAIAFYQSNEFDKAINILTKLLETKLERKKEAAIYSKLAGAYYKSSQYIKAIESYEKLILEYKPYLDKKNLHNLHFWSAESADKAGKTYKAIKHYSLALKEGYPDKKNIHFKLGEINYKDFYKTGSLENAKYAVIHYNKALENKHPYIAKIHFKLGNIYTELYRKGEEKHFKNAEVEYLEALKHTESDKATIHQKLGYIYVKSGMLDKAKAHCHESMRLGNKSYEISTIYGKLKLKSSLYEDAIKYFNYAVKAHDCTEKAKLYLSNLISQAKKQLEEDVYPRDPGAPPPASPDSGNASSESSDHGLWVSKKRSLEDMLGYNPSDLPRKDLSKEPIYEQEAADTSEETDTEALGFCVDYNMEGL